MRAGAPPVACGPHFYLFPSPLPSQVRSTTLDKWDAPSVEFMARVGNVRFNAVYEARPPTAGMPRKPGPAASTAERERYIQANI